MLRVLPVGKQMKYVISEHIVNKLSNIFRTDCVDKDCNVALCFLQKTFAVANYLYIKRIFRRHGSWLTVSLSLFFCCQADTEQNLIRSF